MLLLKATLFSLVFLGSLPGLALRSYSNEVAELRSIDSRDKAFRTIARRELLRRILYDPENDAYFEHIMNPKKAEGQG
jgi:hypothetical protein